MFLRTNKGKKDEFMKLRELKLINFRNYKEVNLEFDPSINFVI